MNYTFIEKKYTLRKIFKIILSLFFFPLRYLIPKKTIIFSGTNNYNYNGNSRFLYEYLSEKTDLQVYWFTRSKSIKDYLIKNRFKYISYSNPIKLILVASFAKIVINDGDNYFNIFGLCDSKMTIKLSLYHGFGPKITLATSSNPEARNVQLRRINKFDYVNFTSEYLAKNISNSIFHLPYKKVVINGFPRNDIFYDKKIVADSYKQKNIIKNYFKSNINDNTKIILYTPTWRPYDYNLPLIDLNGYQEDLFNDFLSKNNLFFIYTLHKVHLPKKIIKNSDRILYVDDRYSLYDANLLMMETDILINDYSTTSVDYSILQKPQLFCIPDYEIYKNTKGFLENYVDTMPGNQTHNFDDFLSNIMNILSEPMKYLEKYENKRKNLLQKYYCLDDYNSRKVHCKFIKKLMAAK